MAAIAIVPLVTKTISLGKNTTFTVLIVQGLHIRLSLIYICLFIIIFSRPSGIESYIRFICVDRISDKKAEGPEQSKKLESVT